MRNTSLLFGLVAVLGAAPSARAQAPRPQRPYSSLFGGGGGETARQMLTINASVSGGYDLTSGAAREGGGIAASPDLQRLPRGGYGQAAATLSYTANRKRGGGAASVSTTGRRYTAAGDNFLGSYAGAASGWLQAARRTLVTASESSSFQPFLSYGFFAAATGADLGPAGLSGFTAPSFDTATENGNQWRHNVAASVTQGLTARTSVSFRAGYDATRVSLASRNLTSYSTDARLALRIARGLGAHGGYGYREGRYGDAPQSRDQRLHNFDVGLDYNRPLSFSRRTTLTFGSGSTVVQDSNRTVFRLTGNAHLTYELRRSWNLALAYTRDAGFLQNLREPVFADSLSLSLGGMASRRVQMSTGLGAALGTVGLTGGSGYNSYFSTSQMTVGMSRHVGLSLIYSFYHSSFDPSVPLPVAASRRLERQSVQGGVTVWLPVMKRAERPDAAR